MEEKFRIAIVIDSYARGGVAMAAQVLLQFLSEKNYEITLFVRNYDSTNMLPVPNNVICLPWEDKQLVSPVNRLCSLINWRNFGKKAVYEARRRKVFPGEYDCAIAYQMIANDVTVVTLEKIRAKRKILWLHGKKNFIERDISFYDYLYSKADKIVCVSLDTESRFQRLMPKSSSKMVTIHNLYDIPLIYKQSNESVEDMDMNTSSTKIVSVGRISKEKGFDRVPDVVRKLTDLGYDIQWYIIGDGDKRLELETEMLNKNVEGRIHLLGHRNNPYSYIKNCDIYVQPSYTEGFCTSTMEAKILCKPVVTTDVPGMREQFIDGETGLIVESSVDGILNGIKHLIENPQLIQKIVDNLCAEPISNEDVLQQTINVIEGKALNG